MGSDNHEEMNTRGLPDIDETERKAGMSKGRKVISVMSVLFPAIGFGLGFAVYKFGSTAKYDANMEAAIGKDLHWACLSAVVFARAVSWVNSYPMIFKSGVMRPKSGNLRANMFVYKQVGDKATDGAVVLEDEGALGQYNRANRSLGHMVETSMPFAATMFLSSTLFPFPTFALVCAFALGRVLHQSGYTTGYGSHVLGFGLSHVSSSIMEGLVTLTALRAFGVL